ncbi:hypothetical protein quinque_008771 [Culex quinquefasciatus]
MSSSAASEIKTNPIKRGRSDDDSDDGTRQPMTLADLLAAMTEQFKLTQERIQAVNTSITEKIDSVKTELNDKLCAASRDIANFKEECAVKLAVNDGANRTLNERVDEVSQEIGALENRNELIVSGVPYLPTENLADYFKAMCDKVGLNETPLPTILWKLSRDDVSYDIPQKRLSLDGNNALSDSWEKILRLWGLVAAVSIRNSEKHAKDVLSVPFSVDKLQNEFGALLKTIKLADSELVLVHHLEGWSFRVNVKRALLPEPLQLDNRVLRLGSHRQFLELDQQQAEDQPPRPQWLP